MMIRKQDLWNDVFSSSLQCELGRGKDKKKLEESF